MLASNPLLTSRPPAADKSPPLTVAYLVSQYPKLSHEFIAREIRALRAAGVRVHTFTVRPPSMEDLHSSTGRAEQATTEVLLDKPIQPVAALLRLLIRHPSAGVSMLWRAMCTGQPMARRRLWQLFYLAEAALLVERMRAAQISHVHVHFANNGADVARLAVAIADRTQSSTWSWSLAMHGPSEFFDVLGSDVAEKVRSAAFVACISDFCRSQLMHLVEPCHWPKLYIVPMTVDLRHYPSTLDERATRRPNPLRILFVGRLVPQKGPQILLDAIRGLGDVELRIVGGGPLAEGLHREVAIRGLSDVVTFVGPVGQDELPSHYEWADVFCLPSFSEGLPVVLMEAMSTGLPVITTRIAGIPELVDDGVSGLVVSPGRADVLHDALVRLSTDRELALRLGSNAVQKVRRLHSPDRGAQLLAPLFVKAGRAAQENVR